MSKTIDIFTCNKMYSNVCSTHLTGSKNCDCCDYNYDKCNNCCNKDTAMCKKCAYQKIESEE